MRTIPSFARAAFLATSLLICGAVLLAGGCAALQETVPGAAQVNPPSSSGDAMEENQQQETVNALREENVRLLRLRESDAEVFAKRLAAAELARKNAVDEVVRMRSRLTTGAATNAEASAMYAQARVLVDRMQEEGINGQSQELHRQAREYLEDGKKALDNKNPGGAAYLFDQVSNLYDDFRKINPRSLLLVAATAALRANPSPSGKVIASLKRGEPLEGVGRHEGWVQVRDGSGRTGWIPADSVR